MTRTEATALFLILLCVLCSCVDSAMPAINYELDHQNKIRVGFHQYAAFTEANRGN